MTDKPVVPAVLFDNIPQSMKDLPRWVCWWYEWRQGRKGKPGKWTKCLLDPKRVDDRV